MWRQPSEKAISAVRSRSSSETILLMTARMRSLPASGAKVSPVRRPLRDSSLDSVTLKASTRVDGSDSEVTVPSYSSARSRATPPMAEWSALDSDSRPTSSKPVSLTPSSTSFWIVSGFRSRTGRVIMPAWQKRQPRVQPRKISTLKRSWTVSVIGTICFCGNGHCSRSCTVRLGTRGGTPGSIGTVAFSRPSSV
jgi:hypothetical protein